MTSDRTEQSISKLIYGHTIEVDEGKLDAVRWSERIARTKPGPFRTNYDSFLLIRSIRYDSVVSEPIYYS